jgi:hypothetical protein
MIEEDRFLQRRRLDLAIFGELHRGGGEAVAAAAASRSIAIPPPGRDCGGAKPASGK